MGNIKIEKITLGMYATNCYYVYLEDGSDCVVFDPADSEELILKKITEKNLNVAGIFLTHGHFDHIYGARGLKNLTGAKIYAGADEADVLLDPALNCSNLTGRTESVTPDVLLNDGETLDIAGLNIKAIFTPGHTKGSVVYHIKEADALIAGDLIFCESVGRTDLPTGNQRLLIKSATEKVLTLPERTRIYPGHGGTTTVGNEKDNNPFLS